VNILFWSNLFYPYVGGVETVGLQLVQWLSQRNHNLLVLTSHDNLELPDHEQVAGVPVERLPMLAGLRGHVPSLLRSRAQVQRIKAEFRPDLIHAFDLGASLAYHLQTAACAPLLLTLQQRLFTHSPDSLSARMLSQAAWVTAVSRASLQEARELVPEIVTRSSAIPNFAVAPPEPIPPLPWPPRLLCLGRMVPQKGFDLALQAMPAILQRFPEARLLLAGDGAERPALEALAQQLQLGSAVEFLGWVDPHDQQALWQQATLAWLPSRYEGLPVVAVQAALAGRPLVATDVGGNAEVVQPGRTGLLCPSENVEAMAEAICQLLAHPQRTQLWGLQARQFALEHFERERCLEQYLELYQRLTQP